MPPGGCIGIAPRDGPIIHLENNPHYTAQFKGNNAFDPGTRVEAGLGSSLSVFDGTHDYPFTSMGDAADWSFHGGLVIGQLPDDGSIVWDDKGNTIKPAWHSAGPGLAIGKGLRVLVDQFSARNKSDGISVGAGTGTAGQHVGQRDGSVIRWAVLEDMHDDGIENDLKDEITIYGSFISSVSGPSTRPVKDSDAEQKAEYKGRVITLDNTLIWLKPKKFKDMSPYGGGALGTPVIFRFWKWQIRPDTTYGMRIRMRNLVLRYDEDPQGLQTNGNGDIWGSLPVSLIQEQTNITVVFTKRTSGLPKGWPTTGLPGFTYFYNVPGTVNGVSTSSMAKTRWNQAVANLKSQKPSLVINQPGTFAGF